LSGTVSAVSVKEVLALVGDEENLINGIKWVEHLDAELQPAACEILYNSIRLKGHTDQPLLVLLLLKNVGNLPVGVLDDVRTQLEKHGNLFIDRFAEAIKKKDYAMCVNRDRAYDFSMPAIVSKFDISNVESILLLIDYNHYHIKFDPSLQNNICLALVSSVFKALEKYQLLDTEQALHVWAHAKYIDITYRKISVENVYFLKPFYQTLINKLNNMKNCLLVHYQQLIEDQDKHKFATLLKRNPGLRWISYDFVSWYYNGDLKRTRNLYELIRALDDFTGLFRSVLREEIAKDL
jgi:hypothetical protein